MGSTIASEMQAAVTLRRVFQASIEKVFEAWTDSEVLARWFGPVGVTVSQAETELKVGGAYLIVLQTPDGRTIRHTGKYLEIAPPERLVFTWVLENQGCAESQDIWVETQVSLDLKSLGDATELVLTHEQLPNKTSRENHGWGWNSSFDCLEEFLAPGR